jgi:hypothetical protein
VKTVASYTVAAIYKDDAFQTRKALSFSSLNILTQKSSPKVRENRFSRVVVRAFATLLDGCGTLWNDARLTSAKKAMALWRTMATTRKTE